MAGDLIREVRRAALAHLKADPGVIAIVDPASLYPSTQPASPSWPFGRLDGFQSLPLDGPCHAGAAVTFLAHGFALDRKAGGQVVETAEDVAGRLGSAIKLALHNRRVPVADGSALLRVRSSQLRRDGDEADAYHALLSVEARVLVS